MTFIIGVVMLGTGLFILSIARSRDGRRTAFMESGFIESAVMLLVIVLVLGGIGILIGSAAELIEGAEV
jgi:hypothetical protein